MINEEAKKNATTRLKKIEGQIRGVMKMVENEKDCIDHRRGRFFRRPSL